MIEHLRDDQPVTFPEEGIETSLADTLTVTPNYDGPAKVVPTNTPIIGEWNDLALTHNDTRLPVKTLRETLIGGTLNYNQLVRNGNFSNGTSEWSVYSGTGSVSNGVLTVTGATGRNGVRSYYNNSIIAGHKYFCSLKYTATVPMEFALIYWPRPYGAATSTPITIENIFSATTDIDTRVDIFPRTKGEVGDFTVQNIRVHDLTAMFGAAIADHIYNLEQSTAGAGVAWFKRYFPNDYYPYSVPTFAHASGLSSHDMIGFNQWDEEWIAGILNRDGSSSFASNRILTSYVPVVPNTTYSVTIPFNGRGRGAFYDANKNLIEYFVDFPIGGRNDVFPNNGQINPVGNNYQFLFVPPIGTAFVRYNTITTYGAVYKNDICINLSWSGTRNGEYEPYVKRSYALDSSLTLMGVPKLDADGNLYFDGDVYASDGTVNRRYGLKTLNGSETWVWNANNALAITPITNGVILDATTQSNIYTFNDNPNLNDSPWMGRNLNAPCVGLFYGASYLFVKSDSITSAEDAKAYFTANPTNLIYAFATPTTESATPYADPQFPMDYGTEYYTLTPETTLAIPVGRETTYDIPTSTTVPGLNTVSFDNADIASVTYSDISIPDANDFSADIKTPTEEFPFLWNYESVLYTDNTSKETDKHIISVYGRSGKVGKSIVKIDEYYALSTTNTVPADNLFTLSVKIPTETNKYLWNYESVLYSDGSFELTDKRVIGVYGDKGVKGDTGPQGPQGNGYTYIEGTQTATTAAWTGVTTELSAVPKGTQILFHLNQTSASNVTLTLTLSNGTTFGPKNVFWKGTTRLSTHYPINSMVPLVYDGTQWYVTAPYTNDNNYDRTRYFNSVKLKTASSSYGIYVGSKDGYQEAASGVTFDINYPILYYATSSAVAAGGTSTNFYLQMPSVSLRETVAGLSLTANQMAYLVGTISGNTFTIDSAVLANAPTTADGKIYIPLGILYSAYQIYFQSSKELYRYDAVRGFGLIQNGTVLSVEKQYYLSTSNESPTGGSWGTTVPDIGTDTFLWTRDKMYYAYGDPGYTAPVCVTQYTSDIVQPAITSSTEASKKYASDLVTTEKATIMSAMSAYVQTSELNSYKEYLGTELQVRDDRISAAATKTELLQVKDDLGDVQEFKVEVGKYLTFDADNGLVLSALNSTVQSVITNSAWQLVTSGKVVQQVDATEGAQFSALVLKALSTGDIPTLTLGHLVISVESDGTVVGRKA